MGTIAHHMIGLDSPRSACAGHPRQVSDIPSHLCRFVQAGLSHKVSCAEVTARRPMPHVGAVNGITNRSARPVTGLLGAPTRWPRPPTTWPGCAATG